MCDVGDRSPGLWRLAWDIPRGGDAHAVVLGAVWVMPLLTNPDVVEVEGADHGMFVARWPGRFAERLS
ncbi:MAG TPA: hypothetical protein VJ283_10655 [Trebonia sp.]|nr:hypothetical protein [Trebonia sp.]